MILNSTISDFPAWYYDLITILASSNRDFLFCLTMVKSLTGQWATKIKTKLSK